jgi:transcriptional regulator EpsA
VGPAVILSKLEQEYLLRVIESGIGVGDAGQLFLWTQGQLQALLPHRVLACLQYDAAGALLRIECLHGAVLHEQVVAALRDPGAGLAARIAGRWRDGQRLPAIVDAGQDEAGEALAGFEDELGRLGLDNVLVHGSDGRDGAQTVFALFGLPLKPGPRHAYFLELLLPYLHMALLRLPMGERRAGAEPAAARRLSAREAEILGWLREGKSNYEIGRILGISALTVKNHLQRIYRALGVANRAHALARCTALGLLDGRALQGRTGTEVGSS